ncbi:hypothetical protein DSECCO2_361050 [anaerobic digester metagenome]
MLPQALAQGKAVLTGKRHVQQHAVKKAGGGALEGFRAGLGRFHHAAPLPQMLRPDEKIARFVIHQQNVPQPIRSDGFRCGFRRGGWGRCGWAGLKQHLQIRILHGGVQRAGDGHGVPRFGDGPLGGDRLELAEINEIRAVNL